MKRPTFWKYSIMVILLISTLSCNIFQGANRVPTPGANQPVKPVTTTKPTQPEAPEANPKPTQLFAPTESKSTETRPNAYYEGISFYYDPALAKSVQVEIIPATEPASDNMPSFEVGPRIEQFNFKGYVISESDYDPSAMFFSVKEYEKLDNEPVSKEVNSLKKLLAAKPSTVSGNIPLLPVWNAAQVIATNVKYIKFKNGEGVRFLSFYAQDTLPVNNKGLFYTFQGMTNDGKYYVSAIFPVNHPSLPKDNDAGWQGKDPQSFADNYKNYVAEMESQLNSQGDKSFTPGFGMLDALIQSIKIDQ